MRTWGCSEIRLGDQPLGPGHNQPVKSMLRSSHLSSYLACPQLIRHVPVRGWCGRCPALPRREAGFKSRLPTVLLCDLRQFPSRL